MAPVSADGDLRGIFACKVTDSGIWPNAILTSAGSKFDMGTNSLDVEPKSEVNPEIWTGA
jgi:hypothetical protein